MRFLRFSLVIVLVLTTGINYAQTQSRFEFFITKQEALTKENIQKVSFINRSTIFEVSIWQFGGLSLLHFYKRVISKELDGDCAFSPSCSNFSAQAIREKGLLLGVLLTSDRLCRCHNHAVGDYSRHLSDRNTEKINDSPEAY